MFLVLIWGVSWPIYKVSAMYAPPLLFAGMRAFLGGSIVLLFIYRMRSELRWQENWWKYCLSALLNTVLFFGLHTIGLHYLPGGLFSVLVYFQPVLLGLFAWMWLGEDMTLIKMSGLVVGFIGILMVGLDGLTTHISLIGVLLGLATALCWALGVVFVKKVSGEVNAYWMVAMQFTLGGLVLLTAGSLTESWNAIEWSGMYVFGLGFGATMGIPVAYVIYYGLVNRGDASKVGVFTFLVPVISVAVSTLFLNEMLTGKLMAGLLLVVVSIYLVQGGTGGRSSDP